MKRFALLLALAPIAPLLAQPAPLSVPMTAANAPAEVMAQARRLAELYFAEDAARKAGAREFRKTFLGEVRAVPAVIALDKANPGLIDVAMNAGLAQLNIGYDEAMPRLKEKLANFFVSNFTPPQLAQAIAFYDSPLGRRTMQTFIDSTDSAPVVQRMKSEARISVTGEDLKTLVAPGVANVLAGADRDAFIAFVSSPTGLRFQSLSQPLLALLSGAMSTEMQAMTPGLQQATRRAIEGHLKASAAKPR